MKGDVTNDHLLEEKIVAYQHQLGLPPTEGVIMSQDCRFAGDVLPGQFSVLVDGDGFDETVVNGGYNETVSKAAALHASSSLLDEMKTLCVIFRRTCTRTARERWALKRWTGMLSKS